jgi:hypothetical protein
MDDHRNVSVSRVYVPNEYTVYLSPPDRKQFAGYEESLVAELQEYLEEHAGRERYALLSPPRVLITSDDDLAVGEFGIATRVVPVEGEDHAHAELPLERPAETMVYKAPAPVPVPVPEPEPEPEPVRSFTLTVGGKAYELSVERAILGRSRECSVRVDDANVSRRHAEVRDEGDGWLLVDLGSTNGTLLNGKRVERERLEDGDTITLGSTQIVFNTP